MQINHEKIKAIREVLGLSTQDLADRAALTRQAIEHWEKGGVKTFRTLKRVSEALGVEPDKLIIKDSEAG